MNITLQNTNPTEGIIKMEITKEDYKPSIDKALKNLRQKAAIPGFRKGMVPMGMVQKMYGKSVLVDEINKIVSDKLFGYINENKINVLGEPIPSEDQKEIDFETQEDFEFTFDIAIAPKIEVALSKKDKLPFYSIIVDETLVDKQIENFKSGHGSYSQVDVIEGKDMAKGLLTELDAEGAPKEGGIQIEDAVLMSSYMKEESEKAKFEGAAKNSVITFSPFKAYEGNEVELSSLLKVDKEKVGEHEGDFSFQINEVTRYVEGNVDQELFDKVFGPGIVDSEEAFRTKIRETIQEQSIPDSDYKFLLDAKVLLEEKAGEIVFPEKTLKRWLLTSNKDRSAEDLDKEFPKIIEDLKFHLIKQELIQENNFKIEEGEVVEAAKKAVLAQFAQYGMNNVPADMLENYAQDMLKKEDTVRNLVDKIMEGKLADWIKEQVSIDDKNVSSEEFEKLFKDQSAESAE
ncbi:trigger factor [Bacteroidales bacterium]|nr:trigger factor [Bacteroidales bacterium]